MTPEGCIKSVDEPEKENALRTILSEWKAMEPPHFLIEDTYKQVCDYSTTSPGMMRLVFMNATGVQAICGFLPSGGEYFVIATFIVNPSLRRRGIGSAAFQRLNGFFERIGAKGVFLGSSNDEHAEFWRKQGFYQISYLDMASKVNGASLSLKHVMLSKVADATACKENILMFREVKKE